MKFRYERVTDKRFVAEMEKNWSSVVARHLHFDDGYTIAAFDGETAVGVIAVTWKELPYPLTETREAYIDIIEVRSEHRRQGLGRRLVDMAIREASEAGVYQIRAWSSDNKLEAIPMWQSLGFALCPATIYPRGEEVHGYYVARTFKN